MATRTSAGSEDQDLTPESIEMLLRGGTDQLLLQRLRLGLTIILALSPCYALLDLYAHHGVLAQLYLIKILHVVIVALSLIALHYRQSRRWVTAIGVINMAALCALTAASAIRTQEEATMPILSVVLV